MDSARTSPPAAAPRRRLLAQAPTESLDEMCSTTVSVLSSRFTPGFRLADVGVQPRAQQRLAGRRAPVRPKPRHRDQRHAGRQSPCAVDAPTPGFLRIMTAFATAGRIGARVRAGHGHVEPVRRELAVERRQRRHLHEAERRFHDHHGDRRRQVVS